MNRTKRRAILALSFLGLASAAGAASAQPATVQPPRAGLAVEKVLTMGPGCPDATAARVGFSPAGDELWVQYAPGRLGLAAGPGVPDAAMGSYCRLQLDLRIPRGYSFAITGVTHEGHAELDRGVTARRTAWHWFSGMVPPYRTVALVGPFSGDYELESDFGPNPRYSACGSDAPLFLLMNVGLSNLDNPIGMGVMDAGDGPTIRYRLAWRRC
jgi:hypothetical protein